MKTLRRISSDFVGKPKKTSENQKKRRISSDCFLGVFSGPVSTFSLLLSKFCELLRFLIIERQTVQNLRKVGFLLRNQIFPNLRNIGFQ